MDDRVSSEEKLRVLSEGPMEISGRFMWGSNHTFLVRVGNPSTGVSAVYKPLQGERPLWDFPRQTLAHREVAAYLISQALGWNLVPPTVLRQDGPGGGGSLQLFVEADLERHYFNMSEPERQLLRPAALFDLIINNADRKGGHVILGAEDRVWLIDHGVCFHEEPKLRTVIWDFVGEPFPQNLRQDMHALERQLATGGSLHEALSSLLSQSEIRAMQSRLKRLHKAGHFPEPGPGRPFPWPLV